MFHVILSISYRNIFSPKKCKQRGGVPSAPPFCTFQLISSIHFFISQNEELGGEEILLHILVALATQTVESQGGFNEENEEPFPLPSLV